jgi:exopolyphosphatase/guanosine-5'-triphosphate,3'-diphosphate pyrophosphatase
MKFAAIDLGTNTFHLIIAEAQNGEMKIIYKVNQPVKLGEDITKENKIIPAAFERGLRCLVEFKAKLDEYEIDKLRAVATSAVRSASNGQEFVEQVKLNTGIAINVIDGEEEADLIYEGVKYSGAIRGKSLIMDIGGGSTEFIFCDENGVSWKKSFDIGAARLMQLFFKSDPIQASDQMKISNHLTETLAELITYGKQFGAKTLIGSAGAFETYALILQPNLDISSISTADINKAAYHQLAAQLISSSHFERTQIPNLIALRVDMIVMASIITNFILELLNLNQIKLSTCDLKFGILQDLVRQSLKK